MEVNEDHVSTLLSMGFPSESEVRKALHFAKNDLNDAVAYLTNEPSTSSYDTLDDIEMKDIHSRSPQAPVYGPAPPPSYEETVVTEVCKTKSRIRKRVNQDFKINFGLPVSHWHDYLCCFQCGFVY